ncbi:Pectinesterase inhibitor 9, partial [Mucuna pruriens]
MASRLLGLCMVLVLHMFVRVKLAEASPFIESACKATRFPAVCVQSLASFAGKIGQSDEQLALSGVSVSVTKTRSSASLAKAMKPAVPDCIKNLDGSVDHLSQSVKEFGLLASNFRLHMGNIQTWVSAALTNQNTCLDTPNVDAKLKASVVEANQITSNALALINSFASKGRVG